MAAEHREAKRKGHTRVGMPTVLLVALAVALIAIIAYSYSSSHTVTSISALRLSFNPNTTFSFAGAYYLAYVHSVNGSGSAVIYLERQPILLNPILEINVSTSSGTFVSPTLGSMASMSIRLLGATSSSATISISYVSPGLSIPPSSSDIRVLQNATTPSSSNTTSTKK